MATADEERPLLFQYIGKNQLQQIQHSFARAVDIACGTFECVVDASGKVDAKRLRRITEESRLSSFCKTVRSTKQGEARCRRCDLKWARTMQKAANAKVSSQRAKFPVFLLYRCHAGLIDMVAPIFVGSDLAAFIFAGQRRRIEDVTSERIAELVDLAQKVEVPPDGLIKAYLDLPEMSPKRLRAAAQLLARVANQISDLAFQVRRFKLLWEAAAALTAHTDPERVYQAILESASKVADCERATLWEYDERNRRLRSLGRLPRDFGSSESESLPEIRQLDEGIAGTVAHTREPACIEDIGQPPADLVTIQKFLGEMRSEYAVPVITVDDVLLGVLTVKSRRAGPWPAAVQEGLRLLAGVAAMAIVNARAMQVHRTLLQTASHELLGPLHAMTMTAEELVLNSKTLSPSELERFGTMALARLRVAEAHVHDMLLVAQQEAQRGLDLREDNVEIRGLIERAARLVRELADEKRVKLSVRYQRHLPAVRVDERRMADIALRNVLHNAVRYAPEGSKVLISARRLHDGIRISVKDCGPGMSPEDLADLGQRFVAKGPKKGLGIGLFAAKAVAQAHDGDLRFASRKGEYFRASIHLPSERTI